MKAGRWLLFTGLLFFFLAFQLLPLYQVAAEGLQPAYLLAVLRQPIYVQGLLNSFAIALCTTALVALIAIPLAILAERVEFAGKGLVNALMLMPLVLPPFVGALGFQQIFGRYGAFNAVLESLNIVATGQGPDWLGNGRFWMVCLIEALHLYPILYLNTVTALSNVNPSMNEAARNLGAGRWRCFYRITLPLIRPGIFAGGVIVFIWSFTELGTPLMLGFNRVTAVQIFDGINQLETNPLPYSLVMILLAFSAGFYLLSRVLFGGAGTISTGKGITGAARTDGWHPQTAAGVVAIWLPFLLVTAVAVLPHLSVSLLAVSRDWYRTALPQAWTLDHFRAALSHPYVVPSILNSLRYSLSAMLLCTLAGLGAAWLTVRWKPPFWRVIDLFCMLPLAVPGIVLAFGYLSMATHIEFFRIWLDPVRNPTVLLIIAYAMRRVPYVLRAVAAGLEQTPEELEEAARNLGAGLWTILRRILAPLLAANILAGALFAFSFSMLEVSDSLILAQKSHFYPITRAIYELSSILGSGPRIACAFGVWAILFLMTAIIVTSRILGKKMGALFRF